MFNLAPAWVYKGAKFDFDFANQRWWGGYVSRGLVGSATDRMKSVLTSHTNSASGVNFYPTASGMLVSSAQAAMRLTDLGLWIEADTTNICLWCRDLTNAVWVATTMTVAKNQIGANDVANSASSLTATAPLATVLQSITSTSGARVFSCYMKRITGSGTISITMDGSTYTDVTSLINSSTYTRVQIPIATTTNPIVGIQITTSGDAIAVDFCQCEKLVSTGCPTVATNPMLTTTTSVTRLNGGATEEAFFNSDSTSTTNAGIRLVNDIVCKRPSSFLAIASGNGSAGLCNICGTDIGAWVGGTVNGGIDGTAVLGATGGVAGLGNINKIAVSIDGANRRSCVNGGAINSSATAFNNNQATHGGIGDRGDGSQPINGYYIRLVLWDRMLSDGEMLEFTR